MLIMEPNSHSLSQSSSLHDSQNPWLDGAPQYQAIHSSPAHEYSGFSFQALGVDSMYTNNIMPPPSRNGHSPPHLHPLVTTPWPSMLTSAQSNYSTPVFTSPAISTPVLSTPISAPPATGRTIDRPRRTLTDADRRRMCEYAEKHPLTKQTEIGALFGVERSTVSKVLRHKEKYLAQEDASKNPLKAKGKFPDVERALANWVKNEKKHNQPVTDDQILEKFRHFSQTVRDPDQQLKAADDKSWLDAFKNKNGIGVVKSRKNSVVDETESKSNHDSPTSPQIKRDASPSRIRELKLEKDSKKMKSESPPLAFSNESASQGHRHYASIGSALLSTATSYPHKVDDTALYHASQGSGQQPVQPVGLMSNLDYQARPRSQTFPIRASSDNGSFLNNCTADGQVPAFLLQPGPSPFTSAGDSLHVLNSHENFITTMGLSRESTTSPQGGLVSSSPMMANETTLASSSPSLDETRRALEVVWTFFHQQHQLEPQEVAVMGKLMDKLKLQSNFDVLHGGMHGLSEPSFGLGRTTAE